MTKEVLILLHGNGEDHTYFKNQMEAFLFSPFFKNVDNCRI